MSRESFTLPGRYNKEQLKRALVELGAESVLVQPAITWTKTNEQGEVYFEQSLPAVEITLPEGVSRHDVEAAIGAHNPEKTDDEERQDIEKAKAAERKAELKVYLQEFLQDKQLIAMLKAALAS